MFLRPRLRGRTTLSRSDPSAGVKEVVDMPLYTGRRGVAPNDLCLFNTDLYRGPFPNNTPMNFFDDYMMTKLY